MYRLLTILFAGLSLPIASAAQASTVVTFDATVVGFEASPEIGFGDEFTFIPDAIGPILPIGTTFTGQIEYELGETGAFGDSGEIVTELRILDCAFPGCDLSTGFAFASSVLPSGLATFETSITAFAQGELPAIGFDFAQTGTLSSPLNTEVSVDAFLVDILEVDGIFVDGGPGTILDFTPGMENFFETSFDFNFETTFDLSNIEVAPAVIPLPGGAALLLTALGGIGVARRVRR